MRLRMHSREPGGEDDRPRLRTGTIFELEGMELDNFVNMEFHRSLFQVYSVGQKLYSESTGLVRVAAHKATGKRYAVKEVKLPPCRSDDAVREVVQEIKLHSKHDHPNICRLQEVFCTEERYYMVMDLCSGKDVLSQMKSLPPKHFNEAQAAHIARRMASALCHCHEKGVMHHRVQLDSFVYEHPGMQAHVKLVDFGQSSLCGAGPTDSRPPADFCTSPDGARGCHSPACDTWALGVACYRMLCGDMAATGWPAGRGRLGFLRGRPRFRGAVWSNMSPEAKDFIDALLQKDPRKRLTAEGALQHPWLSQTSARVEQLPPEVVSSIVAFQQSSLMRRLGLQLLARAMGPSSTVSQVQALFDGLDVGGRGHVLREALMQAMPTQGVPTSGRGDAAEDQAWEGAFEALDMQGVGRVNYNTFLAACLAARQLDPRAVRVVFGRLDKRGRGNFDLQDLLPLALKVMRKMEAGQALKEGAWVATSPEGGGAADASGGAVDTSEGSNPPALMVTFEHFWRELASVPLPVTQATRTITSGTRTPLGPQLSWSGLEPPKPPTMYRNHSLRATAPAAAMA